MKIGGGTGMLNHDPWGGGISYFWDLKTIALTFLLFEMIAGSVNTKIWQKTAQNQGEFMIENLFRNSKLFTESKNNCVL